jgi:hypothetical protein
MDAWSIRRRKDEEELHPAPKLGTPPRRLHGPAIAISGCDLFVDLEPTCVRGDRHENQNSVSAGCGSNTAIG